MIWFVLWLMVAFFAFQGMFFGYCSPDSFVEYFFIGLFYLFNCVFSGIVCFGIAYGIGQTFESHKVEGEHSNLVAIRDKDGVEGRFFLGSGFISNQPYYFYYESLKDGGFRPGKIEADDSVTVYEEDRTGAELVTFDSKITYPGWAWLICMRDEDAINSSYVFHVPKGTIKAGYSM
jgi:hypothetical protein